MPAKDVAKSGKSPGSRIDIRKNRDANGMIITLQCTRRNPRRLSHGFVAQRALDGMLERPKIGLQMNSAFTIAFWAPWSFWLAHVTQGQHVANPHLLYSLADL